jgi:inner membrane transporter RhtA
MTEAKPSRPRAAHSVPPQAWFIVSAIFHYLGPAFAVLLFPAVGVLGVAWLRIASAAAILAPFTRPWRTIAAADSQTGRLLIAAGFCLAAMNVSFYLALERLAMSLVAAIEFIGAIGVALYGLRSGRNCAALALAVTGVAILVDVKWSSDAAGLGWAGLNSLLFVAYVVLGHRISEIGASGGVARLGAAMVIAFLAVTPIGFIQAAKVFDDPRLLAAGIGVGLCSSVIPYVCDQLAMSRLPRAGFAFLLCLLPASAALIGAIVLAQLPEPKDVLGIALVVLGVAVHRPANL